MNHDKVYESKSPAMKSACKSMARIMGWDGEVDHCRSCSQPVRGFRDELSKREYLISGLCQDCQDSVFGR